MMAVQSRMPPDLLLHGMNTCLKPRVGCVIALKDKVLVQSQLDEYFKSSGRNRVKHSWQRQKRYKQTSLKKYFRVRLL